MLKVTAEKTTLRGIVTQPDRPAGRGQKLQATDVKRAASAYDIPIFEPVALKQFASELRGDYDVFIVASYGRILPPAVLELPHVGALNVHPSLLPQYRGATPIQAALRNGDSQTGVSIMLMDSGMDTGPLVLQETVAIQPDEDYGMLHDRLAQVGARLLSHAIDLAAENNLGPRPQAGEASITKPLTKDDLKIDWRWPAQQVVDAIRALSPEPAARTEIGGVNVKLLRAKHVDVPEKSEPGKMLGNGDALLVACGEGAVQIEDLIPASRAKMSGAQFKRWLKQQSR